MASEKTGQAPTMLVDLEHDLLICLHTKAPPRDEEWQEYITLSVKQVEDARGIKRRFRQLVITEGGAPSLAQRKAVTDAFQAAVGDGSVQEMIAVVSNSPYTRFVTTALSIIVKGIRSFPEDKLDNALAYLGVVDSAAARRRVDRLRARLSGMEKS